MDIAKFTFYWNFHSVMQADSPILFHPTERTGAFHFLTGNGHNTLILSPSLRTP
jgi:hypothetical protein